MVEREGRSSLPSHGLTLAAMILAALVLRLLYLAAQPAADPWFAQPLQDGAYYVDWARALAAGEPGPPGAFYLAPLYPYLLALVFRWVGELGAVFMLQTLLSLATAAALGLGGRKLLGTGPSLCAAGLFLLYHPLTFYATAPLGETLAIALLVGASLAYGRSGPGWAAAAGGLIALASLARPNLLLVAVVWVLVEAAGRRWRECGLLAAALLVLLAPVGWRNYRASGHLVPISANSGITLYHGNGPGAVGVYTPPPGMTGNVATQRDEAMRVARLQTLDAELDAVDADRFWARQAIRARRDDPLGTLTLLGRRAMLTLDSREMGLDYAPRLDANRWRPVLRLAGLSIPLVPFGLLLGLAAAGWIGCGFRDSGDWTVWGAVAACALTPLLFYVTSRYRLPMAALLTVPAGVGLSALIGRGLPEPPRRRRLAAGVAVAILAASWLVPTAALHSHVRGQGLSVRALAWMKNGDLERALSDARRGAELAPTSAQPAFNLGVVAAAAGRSDEAEASYRAALDRDPPGRVEAASNLAGILIGRGRAAEAARLLRRTPRQPPLLESYWTNLIVALHDAGDPAAAREALGQADSLGVAIDPGLRAAVEAGR